MVAYLQHIRMVLGQPVDFFKQRKREHGVGDAFSYFAVLSLFSTIMGFIMSKVYEDPAQELITMLGLPPPPVLSVTGEVFSILLGFVIGLGLSFVLAGVLHLWLLLFGAKAGYEKTYQLSVYSATPSLLLSWVPVVGFFAWLYGVYLLVVGTQHVHGFSTKKSILVYVVPLAVLLVIAVLVALLGVALLGLLT